MDFEITIRGTEQCINRIDKLEKFAQSDELKKYIAEKAIAVINRNAKARLNESESYVNNNKFKISKNGILIYNDVQNSEGTYYSLIIEYGSGIYREKDSIHTTQTYEDTNGLYWLVPVEEGSSLFSTDFEIITIEGLGDFFKVYGQTAKHIYEDSAKTIQSNLSRWVREYLKIYMGGK